MNFYSVGKAFVALLALQLVDAGVVGLDDPIASVWPEFGAAGKASATVRHALCHRAGVPAIRERLTNDDLWDWERMTGALAATEPWWEPGTRHAYHTNTYGHLVGEIVRRASGEMPGERLRAVAESIGADLWCGLPAVEQQRCADVIWAPANSIGDVDVGSLVGDALMVALGYFNPPGILVDGTLSTRPTGAARRCRRPTATARPRVSPGSTRRCSNPVGSSPRAARRSDHRAVDGVLPGARRRRHLRPRVPADGAAPTVRAEPAQLRPLRHGRGGRLRRPDARVAFGYVMNHVIPRWQSTRNRALIDAVYRSL